MSRSLRRFYVDNHFQAENVSLALSDRETFHLHRVLRLKPGDTCQIFNSQGQEALAVVEEVLEKCAKLQLKKILPLKKKPLILNVVQALPQKRILDDLVKKAEELGVHKLWITETERTVVKMRPEARERAKNRWDRIVIEAAKQSGNSMLTQIEGPLSFTKVIDENLKSREHAFIFHPDPAGLRFSSAVEGLRKITTQETPASIFLFLGPEGGFTEAEVHLAESRGVQKVFLGDSLLRIDTAFIGAVSALQFMLSQS